MQISFQNNFSTFFIAKCPKDGLNLLNHNILSLFYQLFPGLILTLVAYFSFNRASKLSISGESTLEVFLRLDLTCFFVRLIHVLMLLHPVPLIHQK